MDILLNQLSTASTWCLRHVDQITLALITVLLVLFGPLLSKYLQRMVSDMNAFLRATITAVVYLLVFGLIINFLPDLTKQLLLQLNRYSLFPVLLVIAIVIGLIADRR